MENEPVLIRCDCSMEVLAVEWLDNQLYLAMYEMNKSRSWWWRIRNCWKVITTGTPYSDNIVLNAEKVKELKNFLSGLNVIDEHAVISN